MTRDEAKNYIEQQEPTFLKKVKHGYICPYCNQGSTKGQGVTRATGNRLLWHCVNCKRERSIFGLYAGYAGIADTAENFPKILDGAAAYYGLNFDAEAPKVQPVKQAAPEIPADFTNYYRECMGRLTDPAAVSYLQARGISVETAAACGVGFDPAADPANAPGAGTNARKLYPAPRIIIPTKKNHYVGRAIDSNAEYKKLNPRGQKNPGVFNEKALYSDAECVFVTEGPFDAMSVIEAGAQAVALCSTSNVPDFLKKLEIKPTKATLILQLDNDKAGKDGTKELREGLDRLNISHINGDLCGDYSDPNEALTGNRAAFIEAVERDQRRTAAKPDNTSLYINQLMGDDVERFRNSAKIKTGYANIDAEIDGGLFAGLYILAATSSLGKTTWSLQLADQIAAGGHDVIFFSLEQSRLELVSKSLARITAQIDTSKAVKSVLIREGNAPEIVQKAVVRYTADVGDRVSIVEGNFNCNLSYIRDYVTQYIRRNGIEHSPVLIIDYLQILTPEQDGKGRTQNTKDATDAAVTGLKRLSREKNIPILAISSVNRTNYLQPIDFESLKESGGIEYSADAVWGLQFRCLSTDPIFDKKEDLKKKREAIKQARKANPREIEFVCLKNRGGTPVFSAFFKYYPEKDLFKATDENGDDYRPKK